MIYLGRPGHWPGASDRACRSPWERRRGMRRSREARISKNGLDGKMERIKKLGFEEDSEGFDGQKSNKTVGFFWKRKGLNFFGFVYLYIYEGFLHLPPWDSGKFIFCKKVSNFFIIT